MATRLPESARPVFAWLGDDPNCRQLALQAERLVALQAALAAISPLPGLIPLELDDEGSLKVATPGAAAAAKLRQLEPTLVSELVSRGWKVKRIRFRPQPASGEPPPPIIAPRAPIPPGALAGFQSLAEGTPAGSLKSALANLLRNQSRKPR